MNIKVYVALVEIALWCPRYSAPFLACVHGVTFSHCGTSLLRKDEVHDFFLILLLNNMIPTVIDSHILKSLLT